MEDANKSKKIWGSIISSFIFSLFFIVLLVVLFYAYFGTEEGLPLGIFIFLLFVFALPLLGIIYNLVVRIREILGGEEDEASKY